MVVELGKILVAIDGSEYADYALNVALKIATVYSSRIDLIYVRQMPGVVVPVPPASPIIGGTSVIIPPQSLDSKGEETREEQKSGDILAERLQLILQQDVECSAISAVSDNAADEILSASSSGGYPLVVLGSRGLSGMKSFILGSVSEKVAKEAKCSVLVVKVRIEGIPKILLGYDGSDESKKALDFISDFGKRFGAEVDPAGVVNVPIAPEGMVGADIDKWERELRALLEDARAKLKSNGIASEEKLLEFSDVSKALCDFAAKGSYNMIAVSSRGRGRLRSIFLGSVASGVANSATTNVLIVR
jgi:nucleotide-binding universal stress UspA family protein